MANSIGRWRRRQILAALASTSALALAGRGLAATSGQPVRVGSTLSLTGPLAQTALIHKVTGEISVEELNARGGMLGRPVEWVLLDDQSKPDLARSLYEKLITVDKVDLIIGPYATNNILSAMGVAARYQKIYIQSSMGIPGLAKYDMHFPASPFGPEPEKSFPAIVFDAMASTATPPKTIAILTSKFPSAQFMAEGTREVAKARGIDVVLYLDYEFGNRDFGAIAARVKDANPDFLWVGALGLDGNQLLEALKKLDHTPKRHLYLYPAPGPLAAAPEGKNALAFTFFEEHPPFTERPGIARFVQLFNERAAKAGIPYTRVDGQAAGMFAIWQILSAGVNGAKSLDDKAIAAWLKQNGAETLFGKLGFNGLNNHGPHAIWLKQLQDGKQVVVWPPAARAPGVKLIAP